MCALSRLIIFVVSFLSKVRLLLKLRVPKEIGFQPANFLGAFFQFATEVK